MASFYSITPSGPSFPVKEKVGETTFTVKNTTGAPLSTIFKVCANATDSKPAADADWLKWLTVDRPVRTIAPGASEQILVHVQAPQADIDGTYSFFLRSIYEARPDEDYTDGPVVSFKLAKAVPPPPPSKRWLIFVIIGIALLVGGTLLYLFWPGGMPNLKGKTLDEAKTILAKENLSLRRQPAVETSKEPGGTVISQIPKSGAKIPADKLVELTISGAAAVQVPNVVQRTRDQAAQILSSAGLSLGTVTTETTPSGVPGTITYQNPKEGIRVKPGTAVSVRVNP